MSLVHDANQYYTQQAENLPAVYWSKIMLTLARIWSVLHRSLILTIHLPIISTHGWTVYMGGRELVAERDRDIRVWSHGACRKYSGTMHFYPGEAGTRDPWNTIVVESFEPIVELAMLSAVVQWEALCRLYNPDIGEPGFVYTGEK